MAKSVNITTVDNPHNPFTEWDKWLLFDVLNGYHTCERLARLVIISDQLTDEENNESILKGINDLVKTGAINNNGDIIEYKKVYIDE